MTRVGIRFPTLLRDSFVGLDGLIWSLVFYSVEYNVSYVYHAMFAYFDRDNVALKGFAK